MRSNDKGIVKLIRGFYDLILGGMFDLLDNFFKFTVRSKMFVLNIIVAIMSIWWHGLNDETLLYIPVDILIVDIIAYWLQKPLIRFQELITDAISGNWISFKDIDDKYTDAKKEGELKFFRKIGGPIETIVYDMLDKVLKNNRDKIESKQKAWVFGNHHKLQQSYKGIKSRSISARNALKVIIKSLSMQSGAFYLVDFPEQKLSLCGKYNTKDMDLKESYSLDLDSEIVNLFNDEEIKHVIINNTNHISDHTVLKTEVKSLLYIPVVIEENSVGIFVFASSSSKQVNKILRSNSIYEQFIGMSIESFALHMLTLDSLKQLERVENDKSRLFDEISSLKDTINKMNLSGDDEAIKNLLSYLDITPTISLVVDDDSNILYQNSYAQDELELENDTSLSAKLKKEDGYLSGDGWMSSFFSSEFEDLIKSEYRVIIKDKPYSIMIQEYMPQHTIVTLLAIG